MSEKGIQPLPYKMLTITKLVIPKNIDELHHFHGLTGYYRKFVPLFTVIMKPINKLFWKDTKFQMSTQCQGAFGHQKSALCKTSILWYQEINKLYRLFADASYYAFVVSSLTEYMVLMICGPYLTPQVLFPTPNKDCLQQ